MSNIIGLSHIVFTSSIRRIPESSWLKNFFAEPEEICLANQEFKKDLQRYPDSETRIVIYKPLSGDLPAFELVFSKNQYSWPRSSYGIIIDENWIDSERYKPVSEFLALREAVAIKSVFLDQEIGCFVAVSPDLKRKFNSKMGLCLKVACEAHFNDLCEILALKKVIAAENIYVCFAKVVNTAFSDFPIFFLIDPKSTKSEPFFNDDLGLSTIGWFVKDVNAVLPSNVNSRFRKTNIFDLTLNGREFQGVFLYDLSLPSNEILMLKRS